jgi:hypothetical protein
MKTKSVTAFKSVSDAVSHARIDLSYNKGLALRDLHELDQEVEVAYATEDGEVFYEYQCDIKLLNKYEPFSGCISNHGFELVYVKDDVIHFTDNYLPKTDESRLAIRKAGVMVTSS